MTTAGRSYYKLVERFPLLHIRNDAQLEGAQRLIDELVDKFADKTSTAGESEYLDALSDLVIAYENKRFGSEPAMSPMELVKYLMEVNGLTQADLSPLFGGQSRVSDFLSGKRGLSKGQIEKLSERFKLSPTAFFAVAAVKRPAPARQAAATGVRSIVASSIKRKPAVSYASGRVAASSKKAAVRKEKRA